MGFRSQLSDGCSSRVQKHKEKRWSYSEAGGGGPRAVSSGRDDGALVNVTALDEATGGQGQYLCLCRERSPRWLETRSVVVPVVNVCCTRDAVG